MRLRILIETAMALAAILVATPAAADLYKWVDERGVMNYSNQLPADPKIAKRVKRVAGRLSVYTPDQALLRAIEASHQDAHRTQDDRIESLQRQLDKDRRARALAIADNARAAQAAYERCVAERWVDCNEADPGYFLPAQPVVFVPVRHRSPRFAPTFLKPGTIAGNATGMNGLIPGNVVGGTGYIAGNSAAAPADRMTAARAFRRIASPREFSAR